MGRSERAERLGFIDLSDNMGTVGMASKGRSNKWDNNVDCRRRCAVEGASNLRALVTWIASEFQPADSGTRPTAEGKLVIGRPVWAKQRFFIGIFSGCGRLTSACHHINVNTLPPWDWNISLKFDLTVKENIRTLYRLFESGEVACVWWGLPCSSWSTARRWDGGPVPLRSVLDAEKPGSWLTPYDVAKVDLGNHLLHVMCLGIRIAHNAGAVNVVENPRRSRVWETNTMQTLITHISANIVDLEFCGWGTIYQKSTKLVSTLPNLVAVQRRCSSWRVCSFTGKPHKALVGKDAGGEWHTRLAEPYPLDFCADVANVVAAHLNR